MTVAQKANVRKRLRAVDAVISSVREAAEMSSIPISKQMVRFCSLIMVVTSDGTYLFVQLCDYFTVL